MKTNRRTFLGLTTAAAALATSGAYAKAAKHNFISDQTAHLLESFSLTYPILQAPIGSTSSPELAAAVSEAGGLGSIAITWATPEEATQKVTKIRSLTKKKFAVNYVLYFEPKSLVAALKAGAPIVQFSWGIPNPDIVSTVREFGAKFGVQVSSAGGALAAIAAGADYLVCQGTEAGGHVQSSMPLDLALSNVLHATKDHTIPVFAAGGICTGKDMQKYLKQGAGGISMGTRFVASVESNAHAAHKAALVQAEEKDTVLSVCFSDGWSNAQNRGLRNATFKAWEEAGCPPAGRRPGEGDVLGFKPDGSPFLRYSAFSPSQFVKGDAVQDCAFYAGSGVGHIKDVQNVSEIINRIWEEYKRA